MIKEFIDQYYNEFISYKTKRWCYEDGIFLKASVDLYKATNDNKYKEFVLNYLDKFINDNGQALGYDLSEYSIDDIQAATVLFWAYDITKKEKYKKAADIFYHQLEGQPRCQCGNFFHKKRYPYQVWMDGLYMGQPFYCQYSLLNNKKENIDDTISQFINVRKYLFDENRHLYVHAYDEQKVMQWASKKDGKAPNVWSRACGWMLMALVDLYEIINPVFPDKAQIFVKLLNELIDGLLPYLDSKTKMIYQVVDRCELTNNYLETSGTCMLGYALEKGVRLKMIDGKYAKLGKCIYDGIVSTYLIKDANSHISLGGICQVAGLDNERRNGSTDYYFSEKIVKNEVKGVAPFFMLIAELIRKGEKL